LKTVEIHIQPPATIYIINISIIYEIYLLLSVIISGE